MFSQVDRITELKLPAVDTYNTLRRSWSSSDILHMEHTVKTSACMLADGQAYHGAEAASGGRLQ